MVVVRTQQEIKVHSRVALQVIGKEQKTAELEGTAAEQLGLVRLVEVADKECFVELVDPQETEGGVFVPKVVTRPAANHTKELVYLGEAAAAAVQD